jgi:formate dehydrogenase alpha subunit
MTLTIDGRTIAFEGRPTLLELARANGIAIPSLCDHPLLEPFAACRLCLVEVKGRRGYVPACHTEAEDGQEVRTSTPEIQALRRGILELILSEHPHACLICAEKPSCEEYKSTIRKVGEVTGCVLCLADGRCRLQKAVEEVGVERVHFPALRRTGEIRRDDPFIDRDNSLCILCGRCVRVCHDVRGADVLTFVNRGSETVIGTARDGRLLDSGCRFCGACVDACPTGSLADRSVRYEPRAEEERTVVCPLCAQGCRLRVGLRGGRILAASPDPEGPANRGQACVRGRFLARFAIHHPNRRLRPMVRKDGELRECSWQDALAAAAARLAANGPGSVAVIGSAQASCEDTFVLHRFAVEVLRAPGIAGSWTGSPSEALRGLARAAGTEAPLNVPLADVARAGVVLQLGEDLPLAQPLLGLAVHRAERGGAAVLRVDHGSAPPAPRASPTTLIPDGAERTFLAALLAVMVEEGLTPSHGAPGFEAFRASCVKFDIPAALRTVRLSMDRMREIARTLAFRRPAFILFGRQWLGAGGGGPLVELWNLAALAGARLLPLETEAGMRGALEIRASRTSNPAEAEIGRARILYLAGPWAAAAADHDFVIVQGPYRDDLDGIADVVLPEATAFESEGTFLNAEGRAQVSLPLLGPLGESRPGWRILGALARAMGQEGFDYPSARDVRKAIASEVPALGGLEDLDAQVDGFVLDEGPAGGPVFIDGTPDAVGGPEPGCPVPHPDDTRGLRLNVENKGLRAIRGREWPRS